MLKKVFGPKRDEVTGEWRKLHKQCYIVLLVLYILSNHRVVFWENTTLFKTKGLQDMGVRRTVAVLALQDPGCFASSLNKKNTKLFKLNSHKM